MPAGIEERIIAEDAARIVRDAGGVVVGRTRLQKIAYLLEIAGLGSGFSFQYRHYGPFSDELADAISVARVLDLVSEEERTASWGGHFSIFRTSEAAPSPNLDAARKRILELGVEANPISLELAATAAFLSLEGEQNPWNETARRKPEKAEKLLDDAKALYSRLRSVGTPKILPAI